MVKCRYFCHSNDLGHVQVLSLVTQHWYIKTRQARQISRQEKPSDSCRPGWVTLKQDPLRRAQPGVTSALQSGRKTSKTRLVQPLALCSSLSHCSAKLHGGPLKTWPAVACSIGLCRLYGDWKWNIAGIVKEVKAKVWFYLEMGKYYVDVPHRVLQIHLSLTEII
ncbi:hypothetical protein XENOCAPTIV_028101 [Xenoophorus captivus]|uniref:Uncharacterized protein n=1 Tax=Xenoophorus captivus TaxID=1517983 RepID=A0ABV0RT98_9TELE